MKGIEMYRKHKTRRKQISAKFIIFVLILVLMLIGSGYSLYTSNLYINGNVTLKYNEPKLENIEIATSSGQYFSLSSSGAWFLGASISSSSTFDDDTFGVKGTISYSGLSTLTVTLKTTFTNKNSSSLTNGQIEVAENSGFTTNGESVDTTVASQANGTVEIKLKSVTRSTSGTIKYKISYEIDGTVKYMYLIINK